MSIIGDAGIVVKDVSAFLTKIAITKFGHSALWGSESAEIKIGDRTIEFSSEALTTIGNCRLQIKAPEWISLGMVGNRFPHTTYRELRDFAPELTCWQHSDSLDMTDEEMIAFFERDVVALKERYGKSKYRPVSEFTKRLMTKFPDTGSVKIPIGGGELVLEHDDQEHRYAVRCMLRHVRPNGKHNSPWVITFSLLRSVDMMVDVTFAGDIDKMWADLVYAKMAI